MGLFDSIKSKIKNKIVDALQDKKQHKDTQVKPKSLEQQRRENIYMIGKQIHSYFLVNTRKQVPSLYTNNKTRCTVTMAKNLCIPKEVDFDNDKLSMYATNGVNEAMAELKIQAKVFRQQYAVNYSDCVVEIDWS